MIRKTTIQDLDQIYKLYQHHSLDTARVEDPNYVAQIQRDGFLIALESKEDLAERIKTNFLFHVYEEQGEIRGYINLNKEIYFPEDADNILWFDQELKKNYFHSEESMVMHEIIVAPEHKRKGVGKHLLESCQEELDKAQIDHLFSIVTLNPVTNCPSLIFHARNGFTRACVTMPIDLFGLKNMMSMLFYKKIE